MVKYSSCYSEDVTSVTFNWNIYVLQALAQHMSLYKQEHRFQALPLQWRHQGRTGVSNHQAHDCLLNRLFRCRSKKTSKLRVTGLCEENSAVTSEFSAQRAGNAENVSIWWRHYDNDSSPLMVSQAPNGILRSLHTEATVYSPTLALFTVTFTNASILLSINAPLLELGKNNDCVSTLG